MILLLGSGGSAAAAGAMDGEIVVETSATLPVAYDVDVLVAGGSLAGVEAACEAAGKGASVLLIASRPYLGYDLCATQRLWLERGEKPQTALTRSIFGASRVAAPMQVKNALDKALLGAGVQVLTGCYAVDVLFAAEGGRPAGVVMVNRSGRQIIRAKVIIDATDQAAITRCTQAKFRPFTARASDFKYVQIGGRPANGVSCRKLPVSYTSKKTEFPVYEYTLSMNLENAGFRSLSKAFHKARSLTWGKGVADVSECLFHIPQDAVVASPAAPKAWPGGDRIELDFFRPTGVKSWFVLSGYAGLPREHMAAALRPPQWAVIGQRIGAAAAGDAANSTRSRRIDVRSTDAKPARLSIREHQSGVRFRDKPKVTLSPRGLPVLGKFDVVVVGGGTSGAPAAIAAGRNGARTLVIEYLDELGGVGTAGLISKYWYGYRSGEGKEMKPGYVSPKYISAGSAPNTLRNGYAREVGKQLGGSWDPSAKAEWLRREVLKSGGEIWFNCFGCGAVVDGRKVVGVVVAGPFGRGVVLAKTVIDSTGNADIAAAAGAETQYSISRLGDLSVQVAGYPHRDLGARYVNTAYTMADDTDLFDRRHLLLWGRQRRSDSYDGGQLIDSRERRRVVGEYFLKTSDILNGRTYPDTISHHLSNFDAGAFPTTEMLLVKDMKGPAYVCDLPYRCLIPKGIEGLLVTGLGASADRDAMTLVRMQADLENQGYAAGTAAALAAAGRTDVRKVDIKALQKKLVKKGVLEQRVLSDTDSYPLSTGRLKEAVAALKELKIEINQKRDSHDRTYSALAAVMSHPRRSIPLLAAAHRGASGPDEKLNYALVLGVLGDDSGLQTLLKAVKESKTWGKGYSMSSKRETANTFTEVDRLVIALGFTRKAKAVPALLEKLKLLDGRSDLSHVKAICIALRMNRDSSLAVPLAELLDKSGMAGHAELADYYRPQAKPHSPRRVSKRATTNAGLNAKFREVLLAALLLDCGDRKGKARAILEAYTRDVHGHFAAYARAALDGRLTPSPKVRQKR
jgi:flavin-dependent dehydrogenase